MHVLTQDDLQFFDDNGYVVVKNAVPRADCEAVIDAIFDFLEMRRDDRASWYDARRRNHAIVHLHQHSALWANRQNPRVYGAFADLYGTEKLWVSMDRAGMKPPVSPDFPGFDDKGFVHWDMNTAKPWGDHLFVQGVLALDDTDETMGGFCCVPGFHKNLAEWIAQQPTDRNPHAPDLSRLPDGMKVTPIPMQAGDLVIWNRLLAHGNGRNEGTRPRLAQYITFFPEGDEAQRQARIKCFHEKRAPDGWEKEIPDLYLGREAKYPQAELSPLGRKLLGLDVWE
jgi:ectoine hydroxylase-related dioxygenase (phytanoyl-CoA dioxygenase family)